MLNTQGVEVPEKILVRIQKLLALGTSSNENEAAAAAAKAQELLLKYELEMSQVEGVVVDGKPVQEDRIVINDGHRGVNWKMTVFTAVAETSMCRPLVSWYTYAANRTRTTGFLIGKTADIEMAKYTFNFLVAELERLGDKYVREYSGYEHRTRVRNSWFLGAAAGVAQKLRFEFNERRGESQEMFALVLHKDAALQEYMAQHYPKLGGSWSSSTGDYLDAGAYRDGHETGRSLGSRRALGDGSETKRLGSGS